jgi:hypothetical protein
MDGSVGRSSESKMGLEEVIILELAKKGVGWKELNEYAGDQKRGQP